MTDILKKSITDLPDSAFDGKRVLVRTDFNVPQNPDGSISSDYRIRESLPTLEYLLQRQARVIVMSHLGRPKGAPDPKYSLKPVYERLKSLLPNATVLWSDAVTGPTVKAQVDELRPGSVLLLENVRFEPGETKNDPALAKELASYADIYVDDAFGAVHRAHSSTAGVADALQEKVAGLLLTRELKALHVLMTSPDRPYTAIIGGSKVSTKIDVLMELLKSVNNIVIGGGMVFTFLKAKGYDVGNSLVEDDYIETAKKLMDEAQARDKAIVLPQDVVIADKFAADANVQIVTCGSIPDGWMGLDLGPESTERIIGVIKNSKTVFWNGPLGVFEFPAFAKSTEIVARTLAQLTQEGLICSVLGGGDTQAAIELFGLTPDRFTHVSTGGGATLELLEGKALPGIVALNDKVPTATGV